MITGAELTNRHALGVTPLPLTARQAEVLAAIVRYHDLTGEPVSGGYLSRRLSLHYSTIREHLAALHRKGWLVTDTAPATPARPFLRR